MSKNFGCCLVLMASISFPVATRAQIPTTDGAAIAQGILNTMQQVAQLQQQWEQLKANYNAITGNRGFGDLSTNGIGEYLPQSGSAIYKGTADIAQVLKEEQQKLNENTSQYLQAEQQRRWELAATQKTIALQAYDGAQLRLQALEAMARSVAETQDPKGAAELQARISAEQGIVASEANKLQVMESLAAAEQRLSEQRAVEHHLRVFDPNNTKMPVIK